MDQLAGRESVQSRAIRASDQDREAVLQRLQAGFAEGRLDDDEFDQRMRAALTARTGADLAPLLDNLPAAGGGRPAVPAAPGRRPGRFAGRIRTRSGGAAAGASRSGSPRSSTRAAACSTCGRPS
jgi:hypothetical protein